MRLPLLNSVAELAGCPLRDDELAEIAGLLDGIMDDVRKLRELDLADDVEPVLTFRVEPWT
jgi:hypothetical protein